MRAVFAACLVLAAACVVTADEERVSFAGHQVLTLHVPAHYVELIMRIANGVLVRVSLRIQFVVVWQTRASGAWTSGLIWFPVRPCAFVSVYSFYLSCFVVRVSDRILVCCIAESGTLWLTDVRVPPEHQVEVCTRAPVIPLFSLTSIHFCVCCCLFV